MRKSTNADRQTNDNRTSIHPPLRTLSRLCSNYGISNVHMANKNKTMLGSRVFGRPTFWQTCTSVVDHEDMDS